MSIRSLFGAGADDAPDHPTVGLGGDTLFEIVANSRRRLVINIVSTVGDEGGLSVRRLSEVVASHELDVDIAPGDLNSGQRKPAYVGLYQFHLPKLDEAGFIEYNEDRGVVCATELTHATADLLQHLEEEWGVQRFDGGASA